MPDSQTLTSANTPTGEQQRSLNINDLMTMVRLIQLSASRGVWRAEELTAVGTLYDNLLGFLEASGAISREAPAPAAPDTPEAAGETQPGEENADA